MLFVLENDYRHKNYKNDLIKIFNIFFFMFLAGLFSF